MLTATPDDAYAEQLLVRFALPSNAKGLLNDSSTLFQDTVKDKLGDVFVLKEIPLESSRVIRDALNSGFIDIAVLSASSFPGSLGEYVTGSDIEGSRRRQQSEVGAYELARLEKDGLVGLTFWNAQSRQIISRHRINTLADLKGKKFVVFDNPSREILKEVGASPVTWPAGAIVTALEHGVADAVEVPLGREFTDITLPGQFQSVLTNVAGATEFVFVARKAFWISLTYRAQLELANAARVAARRSDQVAQANTRSSLRTISAQELHLVSFTKEEKVTLQNASFAAWTRDKQNVSVLARAFAVTLASIPPYFGPKPSTAQRRDVYFATVRAFENERAIEHQFGNRRRDDSPNYGLASVLLKAGRRLDDDLENVATIETLERFASESVFTSKIKAAPGFTEHPGILVFVHGYNNSFPAAVRRAAQFAVDVGFDGPVIAFSWPSDGTTLLYFHDEDRISATRFGFTQFMAVVESLRPRSRINILAHSMGTRIVLDHTATLKQSGNAAAKGKYRSLTLAASDTPIEYFRLQKEFLPQIANMTTVYFSKNDRALWLSNELHHGARLGNISGDQLFREPESAALGSAGFDFVNSAQIDETLLTFSPRHGYAFQVARCLADLNALLVKGMGADKRSALNPAALSQRENDGARFWEFNRP